MSNDGPSRYVHGIGSGDLEEPWAGEDDPAVAEALAGRAILLAHRAADETLAEAARRAAAVLSDAEVRAAAIVDRARATASALIAEAQDSIAEVLGARTDEILELLSRSHQSILGALRSAEAELSSLAVPTRPAVRPAPTPVLTATNRRPVPRASDPYADLRHVLDHADEPEPDEDLSTPEGRLAAIRESSRRAAERAASEGRAAQARALQRTHLTR